jgi:hypothetical protein
MTLSNQRRWQLRMQARGRCQECGKVKEYPPAIYCAACQEAQRVYTRAYYQQHKAAICAKQRARRLALKVQAA